MAKQLGRGREQGRERGREGGSKGGGGGEGGGREKQDKVGSRMLYALAVKVGGGEQTYSGGEDPGDAATAFIPFTPSTTRPSTMGIWR